MEFPDWIIVKAWKNTGGAYPPNPSICKCEQVAHIHGQFRSACDKKLIWANRGSEALGSGIWEVHHRDNDVNNVALSNCEILCWDCYKLALLAPV